MRRLWIVVVAVLPACASDREALEGIDARLAAVEERLAALESPPAAASPPVPMLLVPSTWPVHAPPPTVPSVFDDPRGRTILGAGGCVHPEPIRITIPVVPPAPERK